MYTNSRLYVYIACTRIIVSIKFIFLLHSKKIGEIIEPNKVEKTIKTCNKLGLKLITKTSTFQITGIWALGIKL